MTSAVDGLVSGLSTSGLISQLMQVEAAPQTRLKDKVSTAQTAVSSYQSVNTKISAAKTAADSLSQLSTWRGIKATSSSSTVTATATGGLTASAGSLTFDVTELATKQTTTLKVPTTTSQVDANNDGVMETVADPLAGAPDSITVTPGSYAVDGTFTPGTPVSVDISADKSPSGIAAAVNKAALGIKAYVVQTSATEGVLQFTGLKPGAASGFTISGLEGLGLGATDPATTVPTDATIQVGDPNTTGYQVTSSTNTFSGLMPGVTITVAKKGETGVTVNADADVNGIADKFQALVDAANGALSEISTQTAYDAGTRKGSPLTGDFTVRNMSQTMLGKVSLGLTYDDPAWVNPDPNAVPPNTPDQISFGSLSQLGIQLDGSGQLTFDRSKFTAAYNADPTAIQHAGMALGDQWKSMTSSMSTNIKSVITGRNSEIDTINSQIDDWDVRLNAKKLALQKQYSDLEVALGKLKNQSSWLSGQLGGLQ